MEQTAFQIHLQDNVATALTALQPGNTVLHGDRTQDGISCTEEIPCYHKIALRAIAAGEKIIKYGVPIGCAVKNIPAGAWVHLHNMRSLYDERSSHLDVHTGAPKDTKYE